MKQNIHNEHNLSLEIQNKILVYLAQRDHSPKELIDKLVVRFTPDEAQKAVDWAKNKGWIKSDAELSHKTYQRLSEKNKGIFYINQYLCSKGLPEVQPDSELELEKAIRVLQKKYYNKTIDFSDFKQKQKAFATLKNKGFENDVITKSLKLFKEDF